MKTIAKHLHILRSGIFLSAIVLFGLGCQRVQYSRAQEARYVKPTIAVMSFENRTPAYTRWNLGDAFADQLSDRLMQTRRYIVLDRQQVSNNSRSQKAAFTEIGRANQARYLIKGTLTDFGHAEMVDGLGRLFNWGLTGSRTHSIVAVTLYVVDAQTGLVIANEKVEAKVRDPKDEITYEGMTFGGYTFLHTPLGQATDKMLDQAVREIAQAIADKPFQPKIASILNNQIVINGGLDRRLEIGTEYLVRPNSQSVLDPDSGDTLGHVTGDIIGRVRITHVANKFAIAKVIEGDSFEVGQTLFPTLPQTSRTPAVSTSY